MWINSLLSLLGAPWTKYWLPDMRPHKSCQQVWPMKVPCYTVPSYSYGKGLGGIRVLLSPACLILHERDKVVPRQTDTQSQQHKMLRKLRIP